MSRSTGNRPARVVALDGLRGVAALIVVFNHVGMASFAWFNPPLAKQPPVSSWQWWVADTPIHIVWAGPSMVIVFFVLSGYVLALPAVSKGADWFRWSYYVRRGLRLYLPAWGALLFAGVLSIARPTMPVAGASPWLNTFAMHAQLKAGLKTATLLSYPWGITAYTTVLWSMRWEVLFSLLLPLVVAVVIYTRDRARLATLGALACLLVIYVVPGSSDLRHAPHFLALFVLGSLLAFHGHRLPRIPRSGRLVTALCVVVIVALLTCSNWTVHDDVIGPVGSIGLPEFAVSVGAILSVWLALASSIVDAALSTPVCRWLGSRSYSLYLVHQPIVIGIAFALGAQANVLVLAAASVPASLIAADLFWRAVENPAIRISRRAGRGRATPVVAAAAAAP